MQTRPNSIEVCFSPALFDTLDAAGKIVVLVDILRATSTICTALYHGVKEIIPVASVEQARKYKAQGFMVAGERDGKVLDFADFGNSPNHFMGEELQGRSIVYTTTNGTAAIQMAEGCRQLVIGSYLNHKVLVDWLLSQDSDVIILCSGWKNKFNLEDTLFAGALCRPLLADRRFATICDAALASVDLWKAAEGRILEYIEKAAHRERLRKLGLDDVLGYCHTFDAAPVVPVLKGKAIVAVN
jgi:2-phosphosulfolactate phosphatase